MKDLVFGVSTAEKVESKQSLGEEVRCIHCQGLAHHLMTSDTTYEVAEPICGACISYYHLDTLGSNNRVVFIPGISPQWVSHLQKAITVAKQSGDTEKASMAHAIEQWLFAHAKFVKESQWGTDLPKGLNAAVEHTSPHVRTELFNELALANLDALQAYVHNLSNELPPVTAWNDHYKQFQKFNLVSEGS